MNSFAEVGEFEGFFFIRYVWPGDLDGKCKQIRNCCIFLPREKHGGEVRLIGLKNKNPVRYGLINAVMESEGKVVARAKRLETLLQHGTVTLQKKQRQSLSSISANQYYECS